MELRQVGLNLDPTPAETLDDSGLALSSPQPEPCPGLAISPPESPGAGAHLEGWMSQGRWSLLLGPPLCWVRRGWVQQPGLGCWLMVRGADPGERAGQGLP